MPVPLYQPVRDNGVFTVYADAYPPTRFALSWGFGPALRRHIREFDVAHIHGVYGYPALVAAGCARRVGLPYIVRPHGSLDPFMVKRHRLPKQLYHELFVRPLLKTAAAIHFTTEDERRLASWLHLPTPSFVLPHGLDIDAFDNLPPPGTFRRRIPGVQEKKLVLFLSRINFKKGLDILIKGFGLLQPEKRGIHLALVGPDTEGYSRQVRRWIAEEDLEQHVTFVDMLLGRDKLAAFVDSDVFVLPSYSENFGLAALEAMACGRPVVISDRVNICDVVRKREAGIVVECTPAAVAEGIRTLLDNPCLAAMVGANAGRLVREEYSWERVAACWSDIYTSVTASRHDSSETR